MPTTHTTQTSKEATFDSLLDEQTHNKSEKPTTKLRKKTTDEAPAKLANTLIEQEDEYLSADQLHEQLTAKGQATDGNIMGKLYELEQVVKALTISKGGLNSADEYVPVTDKRIIMHINGGTWPECRYVIFHNARICMKEDIPYIKACDKLTTTDVNQPELTGKLKALKEL